MTEQVYDERDELEVQDLATIIGNVVIDYEDTGTHSQRPITIRDTCADWPMEIAGEVQAAGFRRTAQGEPTDAQVLAALNAAGHAESKLYESAPDLGYFAKHSIDTMRAALSAAAAVREEGQGHG